MSERTDAIRFLVNSHKPSDTNAIIAILVDELEAQQNMIQDLRSTIDSHYRRQGEVLVRIGKEIDRIKGVHGA